MKVTIDQKCVEVPDGTTTLEALRLSGNEVPTVCHDERLAPSGACRVCLVRLKGTNRLVTACALELKDGMELEVNSPDLQAIRKDTLSMIAKDYPASSVEQAPEKQFNRWLSKYGLKATGPEKDGSQIDNSNPYFRFDPAACIKCFRCVRICNEVQGANVWEIMDRAGETHVAPNSMANLIESSCVSCGACVDSCPTSAIVDKTRLEQGAPDAWTRTTCPYCGVGCELNVGTRAGTLTQVLPVMNSPVNKGHLCVKGRYAHQFVYAQDRITSPMIRRGGKWHEVSWDEAITYVADELAKIKLKYGPDSIGILGSARAPNEDNYVAQKFARTIIGTNNVDCCARVCHGPTAAAMKVMLGTGAATNSYDDLELASTILVIGCNPTENHPVIGERVRQAVRKGAKLIVIDPRRISIADEADILLQIRPGTNIPVLNAIACAIYEANLQDRDFLENRTQEAEQFREFVKEWTPERAAKICGVSADDIRRAAAIYAGNGPTMSFHGLGMTEHTQGTEGVMALTNLALMTGNIGKPGCGINPLRGQNNVQGSAHMGCEPSNLTGYVGIAENRAKFEGVWNSVIPEFPGLNLVQMLEAAGRGEFKAMWAIGYDVYFTNASAETTAQHFKEMELVIVQDLFMNETASHFGHVFLPACTSFERDGTFMNAERRVQRVRQAIPAMGECKPDWEIVQLVAQRMRPDFDGFRFTSAEDIWEEVRKVWVPGAGMSYARLEKQGLQWPCPAEDHAGTKILHQTSFPVGDRALLKCIEYTPTPEITSEEFPFILNTGRTLFQFNAATMTSRTKNQQLRPNDTLDIHPQDADRLGIINGQSVRVVSRYGEATLPARIDRRVRVGELFATFHSREIFLNLVTSPYHDNKVGSPEYKVTAVRIDTLSEIPAHLSV